MALTTRLPPPPRQSFTRPSPGKQTCAGAASPEFPRLPAPSRGSLLQAAVTHLICTAAGNDAALPAYRTPIPRQRFNDRDAFSARRPATDVIPHRIRVESSEFHRNEQALRFPVSCFFNNRTRISTRIRQKNLCDNAVPRGLRLFTIRCGKPFGTMNRTGMPFAAGCILMLLSPLLLFPYPDSPRTPYSSSIPHVGSGTSKLCKLLCSGS